MRSRFVSFRFVSFLSLPRISSFSIRVPVHSVKKKYLPASVVSALVGYQCHARWWPISISIINIIIFFFFFFTRLSALPAHGGGQGHPLVPTRSPFHS